MYYYIIDLGNKQIARMKEKMEMQMASYGISGDFGKISPLSSAYELTKRAIGQNYSTIVAVGDNETVNQVAQAMVNCDVTMGIIPIGADESICNLVGTNSTKIALEILRTRKIETIDVGKISESKYFLTNAIIKNNSPIPTVIDFDNFRIGGNFEHIVISNGDNETDSFKDGRFAIKIDQDNTKKKSFWNIFKKRTFSSSIFYQDSMKIDIEKKTEVYVGKEVVAKTPCEISLLPFALKLVVARLRKKP